MVAINKSTQILIDNFISTHFANVSSENQAKIKESVVEIADAILEQSNKDLDKLATKGDLRGEVASLKDEIMLATKNSILEAKYDLLKWLITAQLAIAGLLLALIKFV